MVLQCTGYIGTICSQTRAKVRHLVRLLEVAVRGHMVESGEAGLFFLVNDRN